MKKSFLFKILLLLLFTMSNAFSQTVSFVTMSGPGSQSDTAIRYFLPFLSSIFSKDAKLIIENKPGAAGVIALNYVSQKPADGNTILICNSSLSFLSATQKDTFEHDPITEFVPLYGLTSAPGLVLVPASSGVKNIKDLIELSKKKGKLLGGSTSVVTDTILKQFDEVTGTKTEIVGYKQPSEMALNLSSGLTDYTIAGSGNAATTGLIDSGKIIPIAMIDNSTITKHTLPTLKDLGYKTIEPFAWTGFCILKDTPKEIKDSLKNKLKFIMNSQQAKDYEKNPGSPKISHDDANGVLEVEKREYVVAKRLMK